VCGAESESRGPEYNIRVLICKSAPPQTPPKHENTFAALEWSIQAGGR
jgi:hypothetical protein